MRKKLRINFSVARREDPPTDEKLLFGQGDIAQWRSAYWRGFHSATIFT
jgi:hypothetical protein